MVIQRTTPVGSPKLNHFSDARPERKNLFSSFFEGIFHLFKAIGELFTSNKSMGERNVSPTPVSVPVTQKTSQSAARRFTPRSREFNHHSSSTTTSPSSSRTPSRSPSPPLTDKTITNDQIREKHVIIAVSAFHANLREMQNRLNKPLTQEAIDNCYTWAEDHIDYVKNQVTDAKTAKQIASEIEPALIAFVERLNVLENTIAPSKAKRITPKEVQNTFRRVRQRTKTAAQAIKSTTVATTTAQPNHYVLKKQLILKVANVKDTNALDKIAVEVRDLKGKYPMASGLYAEVERAIAKRRLSL